jgi:hypothetical protein
VKNEQRTGPLDAEEEWRRGGVVSALKDQLGDQRGWSEWEPIKILPEG